MIEFGQILRKAREERGLTQQDLAARTNLMVQQIDELEREDFSRIAAPVYGRGFVRLYCEAVGLDANTMIAEFMEILNGNREPVIRLRETPAPAAPEPAPEPAPDAGAGDAAAPGADVAADGPDGAFRLESEAVSASLSGPDPAFAPHGPSSYRTRLPIDPEHPERPRRPLPAGIPPAVWRVAVLCAGAALVVYLLVAAVRGLYRLTMGGEAAETVPAAETAPAAPAADESGRPAGERVVKPIPPLYID